MESPQKRKKVPYDLRWIVGNLFFMRLGICGGCEEGWMGWRCEGEEKVGIFGQNKGKSGDQVSNFGEKERKKAKNGKKW